MAGALSLLLLLQPPYAHADGELDKLFTAGQPISSVLSPRFVSDVEFPLVSGPVRVQTSREGLTDRTRGLRPDADFAGNVNIPRQFVGIADKYWILKLHYRVHSAASAMPAYAVIGTSTNNLTTSSINVATRRVTSGFEAAVGTAGLIGGTVRSVFTTGIIDIAHENYLREGGIHAGTNPWSITLDPVIGHAVDFLEVLPDSSLTLSATSPDEMKLSVPSRPVSIAVGHVAQISVLISRRGKRPDASARVHVLVVGPAARLESPDLITLPALADGQHVAIRIVAVQEGTAKVVVRAVGAYNPVSAAIDVRVGSRARFNSGALRLVGFVVLGCCLAFFLVRRVRSPRPN
jgi:hypothetical protein